MKTRASKRDQSSSVDSNFPLEDLPEMEDPFNLSLEAEPVNEFKHPPRTSHLPWTWERLFYRSLTAGSVMLSPLFAFFVYQSITQVRDLALQEFGAQESTWASATLSTLAMYFTAAYFLGDPPYLNPVEEAEHLLAANALEEKESSVSGHRFARLNKTLALGSFVHFAADNALAIAGLTGNNRFIYLGLGLPFTLFSLVHQYVTNKRNLEVHSQRFIQAATQIHTSQSCLFDLVHTPLNSLEVIIEAFSEVAYSGISAGYIADQMAKVFGLKETDPEVLPWILSATFLTAYITAFLKTLPPYKEYFNPEFETLSAADFRKLTLPFTTHLFNACIALTRSGSLGWLMYRFSPGSPSTQRVLTGLICLIHSIHPFYVLYQKSLREEALAQRRRTELFPMIDEELDKREAIPESETLFNKISTRLESPAAEHAVTLINVSARIGQLLAFIGFIAELLETLSANGYSVHFNFKDTVALAILWGSPIAIIDGKSNQQPLVQALAYHRAKWRIGAPTEELAKSNSLTCVIASFFYSKGQFSKRRLREALRILEGGEEVEMAPLKEQPYTVNH